jgi:hypothetical protein
MALIVPKPVDFFHEMKRPGIRSENVFFFFILLSFGRADAIEGVKSLELINIKRRCTQLFPFFKVITRKKGKEGRV